MNKTRSTAPSARPPGMIAARLGKADMIGAGMVALIGAAISWYLGVRQEESNRARVVDEFHQEVDAIGERILRRLQTYEYGLRGARGAVVVARPQEITARQFAEYMATRDLPREFPGAAGVGVVRRVAATDTDRYLAEVRDAGDPDFAIRELSPNSGDRFIVRHVFPEGRDAAERGLDFASEPRRRQAALAAALAGAARLSAPIARDDERGGAAGEFLLLLPVYRAGARLETPAERLSATEGWTYAPLRIDEALRVAVSWDHGVELTLSDDATSAERPFFATAAHAASATSSVRESAALEPYGRRWRIDAVAGPDFVRRLALPRPATVTAVGIAVSGLLSLVIGVLLHQLRRRREIAHQRARLAAIAMGSSDAIVGTTLRGIITDWNPAAEQVFGYTAQEILGREVSEVLVPADLRQESMRYLARVAAGKTVPHYQTRWRHRDGREIDVSISISPIHGPGGAIIGASKFVRDVTESHRTREALREAQTRLVNTARANGIGLWDWDVVSGVLTWDDTMFALYGRRREAFKGAYEAWREALHPDDAARGEDDIRRALAGEAPFDTTFRVVTTEGEVRHIRARAVVERGGGGEALRMVGTNFDITPQKRGEDQLREALEQVRASAGRWRELANSMPQLVWTCRGDGPCDFLSEQWVRYTGIPEAEQLGAGWLEQVHVDDRDELTRRWQAAVDQRSVFCVEFRIRRHDGVYRWFDTRAVPLLDPVTGQVLRWVGSNTDIEDRRQVEAEVRQLNASLEAQVAERTARLATAMGLQEAILRNAAYAIIATDLNGVITVFNPAAERLLGYRADEMVGKATPERIHDPAEVETRAALLSAQLGRPIPAGFEVLVARAREGLADANEWTYVRKDGQRLPVWLSVSGLRDGQGALFGFLGSVVDQTERRAQEHMLEQRTREAEAATMAKSHFLASMSHEIRTPLNAVINIAYLLEQTPLNADQRSLLSNINIAGRSLLGVINDVLDLSKIEAGELRIVTEALEPRTIVAEVAAVFNGVAQQKGLEFATHVDPGVPRRVRGDRLRLTQMLNNLVSNAIKFTEQGRVELRVEVETAPRLVFSVTDSGIGIDASTMTGLFKPFVQADSSWSRRYGGTGLGLAIVRRLAEASGGQAGCTSEVGKGSRFWVRLPMPADTEPVTNLGQPRALRTLLVHPDPSRGQELAEVARSLGWRVERSASEEEAFAAMAKLSKGGQALDLVIIDATMARAEPGRVERLCSEAARNTSLTIGFVVPPGDDGSAIPGCRGDVDLLLVEPLHASTLFDAVQQGLASRLGAGRDALAPSEPRGERLAGVAVLVVDDSFINLEVAERILASEGASVLTVNGGQEALTIVGEQDPRLDIVLMDIQMPGLDGYETAKRMLSLPGRGRLPIVAVTAGVLKSERERAMAAGMCDFISKPFDPDAMLRVMRRFLPPALRGAHRSPASASTRLATADGGLG